MAKTKLLIDTDIVIDYLRDGSFVSIIESNNFKIYCSVVTRKELFSKRGLTSSERETIQFLLRNCKLIPIDHQITILHSRIVRKHPRLEKADALIAASALSRKLPLFTRNLKHYKNIEGLILFKGS